jgi:dienelactone hydrolase
MGFSLGGHLSVAVASRSVTARWLGPDQNGFAAHVGFYPVCKWLNQYFKASEPTGAPILILSGEKDSWGDGKTCASFCEGQEHPIVETLSPNRTDAAAFKSRAADWRRYRT